MNAVHIMRIHPEVFALEWLTGDEQWTREKRDAGNFCFHNEEQVDAIATRNHGIVPVEGRRVLRTPQRWIDLSTPASSL